jgi:hypothetical protein
MSVHRKLEEKNGVGRKGSMVKFWIIITFSNGFLEDTLKFCMIAFVSLSYSSYIS